MQTEIAKEKISCGHFLQWLPRGSQNWKCEICEPPKKGIYVARRRDARDSKISYGESTQPQHVPITHDGYEKQTQPAIIAYEQPACPRCLCTYVVEHYGPNAYSQCWSCRVRIEPHELAATLAEHGEHTQRRLLPWN